VADRPCGNAGLQGTGRRPPHAGGGGLRCPGGAAGRPPDGGAGHGQDGWLETGSLPAWRAFWPGTRRSTPTRYRFEVTGPIPLKADIVVEGDQARLEPAAAAQANVTFHCATEPFVLLLYGRLTLPHAIATGRIAAEGEMDLIPVFAQWFRGV
jgi:SCP-2 sterol transfer family